MKILYCIHPPDKDGEKAKWKEVGVGFVNRDGSVNVFLHAQPGTAFQLRDKKDDEDK